MRLENRIALITGARRGISRAITEHYAHQGARVADDEFTTLQDASKLAVHLAAFPSTALSGQFIVVCHGWHMQ